MPLSPQRSILSHQKACYITDSRIVNSYNSSCGHNIKYVHVCQKHIRIRNLVDRGDDLISNITVITHQIIGYELAVFLYFEQTCALN